MPWVTDWETRKKSYLGIKSFNLLAIYKFGLLPLWLGDHVVYNGAAVHIARLPIHGKKLGVDPLTHDHKGELHCNLTPLEALLDFF